MSRYGVVQIPASLHFCNSGSGAVVGVGSAVAAACVVRTHRHRTTFRGS